jgi:hypothetical protein
MVPFLIRLIAALLDAVQRWAVKPYRGDLGTPAPPLPSPHPDRPLGDEVLKHLKHLEEWGYGERGDSFGDLTLRDEVLRQLEEAICLDRGHDLARPTNREPSREPPAAQVPRAPDREHPLWDRDLDG